MACCYGCQLRPLFCLSPCAADLQSREIYLISVAEDMQAPNASRQLCGESGDGDQYLSQGLHDRYTGDTPLAVWKQRQSTNMHCNAMRQHVICFATRRGVAEASCASHTEKERDLACRFTGSSSDQMLSMGDAKEGVPVTMVIMLPDRSDEIASLPCGMAMEYN